jgi:PhnB protein
VTLGARGHHRSAILGTVNSIEPQLWIDQASAAVTFYATAFGAEVLHRVGDGDDIVVQLAVGDARFWVTAADASSGRLSPPAIGGTTGRTLLIVDDPGAMVTRALAAGAREAAAVGEEHGWLLGRIVDPFGHEWEIGRPTGTWPPG